MSMHYASAGGLAPFRCDGPAATDTATDEENEEEEGTGPGPECRGGRPKPVTLASISLLQVLVVLYGILSLAERAEALLPLRPRLLLLLSRLRRGPELLLPSCRRGSCRLGLNSELYRERACIRQYKGRSLENAAGIRLRAAQHSDSGPPQHSARVSAALAGLREPVDTVDGVGPRRREDLERRLGIYCLADSLVNLPERISDKSKFTNLSYCGSGDQVTLELRVESMRAGYLAGPSAPNLLRCSDLASGKPVDILFFMGRFSYRQFQAMSRTIVPGMDLLVHGKIQLPPAPHETPTTSIASSRPSRSGASKPSKAKPAFKLLRAQIVNPEVYVESSPENRAKYLTTGAVYWTPSGVSNDVLRSVVSTALGRVDALEAASGSNDWMSPEQRAAHGWPSLSRALKSVHLLFESAVNNNATSSSSPSSSAQAQDHQGQSAAKDRLAFDELVGRHVALLRNLAASKSKKVVDETAPVSTKSYEMTPRHHDLVDIVRKNIRFSLTACQETAVASIQRDLASPRRMVRLVQGDVGSGKTVVSALAAAHTVASGWQCGFLAPTELLAKQHFERLVEYFRGAYVNESSSPIGGRPVRVELITGAVRGKAREQLLDCIRSGEIDVLVGTHALLSEAVLASFPRLGLAVVDEEQRFGVAQRGSLADATNVLYTTATPIPRSLMMTLDGVVEVSSITSLPPNKRPIKTILRPRSDVKALIAELRPLIEHRGSKAFWVTPAISPSAAAEHAGTSLQERLRLLQGAFPGLVAAVHGKMDVAERQRVLGDFRSGRTRILVATSVIEVGIDVPGASICIVDRPERFGLSQLHQIRGRIGRGPGPIGENLTECMCVLLHSLPSNKSRSAESRDVVGASASAELARARLDALAHSSDGFEIAEQDLVIRGPGDSLGLRQSGAINFKVADMRYHARLLAEARHTAKRVHNETYFASPSASAAAAPWLDLAEELFCAVHRPANEEEEEDEEEDEESGDWDAAEDSADNKKKKNAADGASSPLGVSSSSGAKVAAVSSPVLKVDLLDTSSYVSVVVDLETSGFSPAKHNIIQLGAALVPASTDSIGGVYHHAPVKPESAFFGLGESKQDGSSAIPVPAMPSANKIETFGVYIRPDDDNFRLSAEVTEITGITKDRLLRDGVEFSRAWAQFGSWLQRVSGGKPVVLLAHNGKKFDFKFLHAELTRHNKVGDVATFGISSFVDSLEVFRDRSLWRTSTSSSGGTRGTGVVALPSSFSLSELHLHVCGIPLEGAHDAGADSAAVVRILGHAYIRDKWRKVAHQKQLSSLV